MRLTGKEAAQALAQDLQGRVAALQARGVTPTLALIRVGQNPADESYAKGICTRAESLGVAISPVNLPMGASAEEVLCALDQVNGAEEIHGCLLFRPLPEHLKRREWEICNRLAPEKDVDGMTALSAAGVYAGKALGYPPCTAQACMELLDYYGIDPAGKQAAVLGRSLVIGRPAAMMLTARNATVSLLHTATENPASYIRQADILITAAGQKNLVTADLVHPGQVILDVSMNYDPEKPTAKGKGGMVGDCDYAAIEPLGVSITPVPGGVGALTNTVLMKHLIQAAEKATAGQG